MKTIIYSRVSTTKQSENGHSLKNQIHKLHQYCQLNNLNDVEVITETKSGKNISNREGFQRMIELIKTNDYSNVVVYSLSRFGRNTVDVLKTVELFNKYNVSFHSLSENLNTQSSTGKFFLTVLSGLSQLEREQISERVSDVLKYKKERGERIGQIAFGFRYDESINKVVKDKNESYTINLIKKLRKIGYSFQDIANELVKRNRKNKNGDVRWFKQNVHRLYSRIS